MEKKYQIFISSTFKDLKTARLKVRDAILSIYHFPVGMEMFGAADEDQWEIIKKDIDESDYYILIIGKSFGSEVLGEGISYTQKEFRYAVSQGIPVLAFIMKEDTKVAASFQETDKDRIRNRRIVSLDGLDILVWFCEMVPLLSEECPCLIFGNSIEPRLE